MYDIDQITEESVKKMTSKEISLLIDELQIEYNILDSRQLAIKLCINSMYGVYANEHYYFHSYGIAESITGIGRMITQSTKKVIDKYFTQYWHKDYKLHAELGLTKVTPIKNKVVVYCDTDSVYFALDEVYANVEGYKHSDNVDFGGTYFSLDIYKHRLDKYVRSYFKKLSTKYKGENLLNLELEKISRSGVFLTKKKYALDISWKAGKGEGIFFEPSEYITLTGGEIAEGTFPPYFKTKLKPMITWLLEQDSTFLDGGVGFNVAEAINRLSIIKDEYMLQDVDVVSRSCKINYYDKYIITDNESITFKKKTPWNVKAAAYYNHLLNNRYSKFKNKYPLVKDGDVIKYYYMKSNHPDFDRVAYLPNMFPIEFAPEIDREVHFNNTFLTAFNRYMKAIGQNPIDIGMTCSVILF